MTESKNNFWEKAFDVETCIEDILKQKNVYISHMGCSYINYSIPKDLKRFVNPMHPYTLRLITDKDELTLYDRWISIV